MGEGNLSMTSMSCATWVAAACCILAAPVGAQSPGGRSTRPAVPRTGIALIADTLFERNPRLKKVDLLEARRSPGRTLTVVLAHAYTEGDFEDTFADDVFAVVVMDTSLTRINAILDVIPTARWGDYGVSIVRVTRDSVILAGAGGSYGDSRQTFRYSLQRTGPADFPRSRPGDAPRGDVVHALAAKLGLPSLVSGVAPGATEIRAWEFLGTGRIALYRMISTNRHWTRRWGAPADRPDSIRYQDFEFDGEGLWTLATEDDFFALPSAPIRNPGFVARPDGASYVIEAAVGPYYHIAGVEDPHLICSAYDRRFLRFMGLFLIASGRPCPAR